jgi:hypothetical protein
MYLVSANKMRRLLLLSLVGHVQLQELVKGRTEIESVLADFPSGFRLLSDLSQLELMDKDCPPEIGRVMELCDSKGVELVIRVIPDPTKDIGLNILSLFHYPRRPRMVVCENLNEALKLLIE